MWEKGSEKEFQERECVGCNSDIVRKPRGWREWELYIKGWRAGAQGLEV